MTPNSLREEDIFVAALELSSPTERAVYVDQNCGDNAALRQRVEALLCRHVESQGMLDAPPPGIASTVHMPPSISEAPGTMIGPYKLLEQIGAGGMGAVYMAEQKEPVRRTVALKVIKPGMDTQQVVARFEAERQALAMMNHPNIARVLDAGATAAGRPYFVMELVKGTPITDFCDGQKLDTRERLRLFITICQAVQHAHQKGLIHRDLKPSNLLVEVHDVTPIPKVIDFGVAKAIGQPLTDKTLHTGFTQMVGTPLYMSPEQAGQSSIDIDTRSDVYSLGVLLYEILTGQTPFERETLRSADLEEMRRIIREVDPPLPSARIGTLHAQELSTVCDRRKVEPRRLTQQLRGELDWIVMKALEKDRTRRYESATALAADVQRFLNDEPVQACPPSLAYRLQKFVRRNRVLVSFAAVVAAMLFLSGSFGWLAYLGELRRADLVEKTRLADQERSRQQWARDFVLPQIERSIADKQPVAAFRLAQEVQEALPEDPRLKALWEQLTDVATLRIEPSGTRVFIRDWNARDDDWLEIGQAPLGNVRLPKGDLRWKLVKECYVTLEMLRPFPDLATVEFSLAGESDIPQGMVAIPGAKAGTSRDLEVDVGTFFIDRFEVTNREYQKFVDAGGYQNPQYWKHEFRKAGKTMSRDVAMAAFRDQTGKPGPATWSDGHFPVGEDDFPVRGVSWYEAAAFAEFAGKSLPTVHHWQRGAHSNVDLILPLSNFSGRGPAPVGSHPGIGSFGVYDMAGNVTEWCSNELNRDIRTLRGGAWDEPVYMFTDGDTAAPMARSINYGFRCVKYLDEPSAKALTPPGPPVRKYDEEPPATPEELAAHLRHFEYDKNAPLNAETRSIDCEPAAEYRHDIVQIDAAYGAEKFNIHLFFPRDGKSPYETIVYSPGAGASYMDHFALDSKSIDLQDAQRKNAFWVKQDGRYIPGLMNTGRVLCVPIYIGTFERRAVDSGTRGSVRERAVHIQEAQDLSRTVDYLQSRADIDCERLIYVGFSRGARLAPVFLVVEPRFRAAVLISGGYGRGLAMPEVESRRYAPHVKLPVLMINGLDDGLFSVESSQMPMYRHLGSTDKQIKHFEAGHVPPTDETVKFADKWLRSRMGTGSSVHSRTENQAELRGPTVYQNESAEARPETVPPPTDPTGAEKVE